MRLIDKETGDTVSASAAGGAVLLNRGTHVLPAKPKAPAKKPAAAKYETSEIGGTSK